MKKIIDMISKNIYIMQILLLIMFLANGYFVTIVKENNLKDILIGVTWLGVIMGLSTTIISIIEAKQVQKFVIVILDFLLIIITYASVYACIYSDNVNSFEVVSGGIPYLDLLYYSFVTFTTLGYGDVLPISYLHLKHLCLLVLFQ